MNGITPDVAMYVAAAVAVMVWLGIFAYLWRIDGRVRALRKALDERQRDVAPPTPARRPERQSRRAEDRKETTNA